MTYREDPERDARRRQPNPRTTPKVWFTVAAVILICLIGLSLTGGDAP